MSVYHRHEECGDRAACFILANSNSTHENGNIGSDTQRCHVWIMCFLEQWPTVSYGEWNSYDLNTYPIHTFSFSTRSNSQRYATGYLQYLI